MNIFSKISSVLLAVTVVISTFGQVRSAEPNLYFAHSEKTKTPAFSDLSNLDFWAIIDFDESSISLFDTYSTPDSGEDQKYNAKVSLAKESTLERISSQYLAFSGEMNYSAIIAELLYPFHFYF